MAFSMSRPTRSKLGKAHLLAEPTQDILALLRWGVILHVCIVGDIHLSDLPKLLEVCGTRIFGMLRPKTDEPPLPVVFGMSVLHFHSIGQCKEGFRFGVHRPDDFRRMPACGCKPNGPVRSPQVVHKGLSLFRGAGGAGSVECGDSGNKPRCATDAGGFFMAEGPLRSPGN